MNITQACQYLRLSTSTLKRLIFDKQLNARKVTLRGSMMRWDITQEDLENYINSLNK